MQGLTHDVVRLARENHAFRREVVTGHHLQVVLMSLERGADIGEETHDDLDQLLVVVEGEAEALLDGQPSPVGVGGMVFVPAGTRHNLRNTGPGPLRLYTVYGPPEHRPGTVVEDTAASHEGA